MQVKKLRPRKTWGPAQDHSMPSWGRGRQERVALCFFGPMPLAAELIDVNVCTGVETSSPSRDSLP